LEQPQRQYRRPASTASHVQRTPLGSGAPCAIDLTRSSRLANPQALVGVVRAPERGSGARTSHVAHWPEFASAPPMGWGGWDPTTATKHADVGSFCSEIVRSPPEPNGHRFGETGPSSSERFAATSAV
jgi:hypothetical protein